MIHLNAKIFLLTTLSNALWVSFPSLVHSINRLLLIKHLFNKVTFNFSSSVPQALIFTYFRKISTNPISCRLEGTVVGLPPGEGYGDGFCGVTRQCHLFRAASFHSRHVLTVVGKAIIFWFGSKATETVYSPYTNMKCWWQDKDKIPLPLSGVKSNYH